MLNNINARNNVRFQWFLCSLPPPFIRCLLMLLFNRYFHLFHLKNSVMDVIVLPINLLNSFCLCHQVNARIYHIKIFNNYRKGDSDGRNLFILMQIWWRCYPFLEPRSLPSLAVFSFIISQMKFWFKYSNDSIKISAFIWYSMKDCDWKRIFLF